MKAKLTITVDERLVPEAKQYARARGTSLSRVIENALREVSRTGPATFTARWRGQFRAARRPGERYRRLVKRYL